LRNKKKLRHYFYKMYLCPDFYENVFLNINNSIFMSQSINTFIDAVAKRNPNEPEFMQAVKEVAETVIPFIEENKKYQNKMLLERMVEPERVIMFRVTWVDDAGNTQVNRGYRIQMNSAIGPYKGGIRFHPTVNLSILKFLAFEQTFKNSLTTLPMGGGKGGSDFDPKGKSDNEIMKFCQSFMTELSKHIGADTDVPAGDIGVGGREVGFMFGQYKRLRNEFTGVLTGKGISFGGSLIRPEATGYGDVYFAQSMLQTKGDSFTGKTVVVSGSGNVAQYACEKATQLGGKVVTLSDSAGYIYDADGIDAEKLAHVMEIKNVNYGRISDYIKKYPTAKFVAGKRPWEVKCDVALPCATQNELNEDEAKALLTNGCICVAEGANMPSTPEAVEVFLKAKILFAPGKASNAGGVATSGLEMSQNSLRLSWTTEEVDERLKNIMLNIHASCVKYGTDASGYTDYVKGANIAGFVKVADAMLAQGIV
jgi:glutamate dehydrogenase (NADP+)